MNSIDEVNYRQEIMQDLEDQALLENIKSFAQKMITIRRYVNLIGKLEHKYHKEGWFFEAAKFYCEIVKALSVDLIHSAIKSRGLLAFREYMMNYVSSECFTSFLAQTINVKAELGTVKYCVLIKDGSVTVRKYESEIDYSAEVEETFEKFKQGAVKDYRVYLTTEAGMNHIEAKILDSVAKLYPDIFLDLDNYCAKNADFVDETVRIFDREIQFYVAYLEYIVKFKRVGLTFCYPQISSKSKEVYDYEGFDLALANKLITENSPIVCNDFYLKGGERIFVVSGPNQGGKTTFARTFGQLHYLASMGCPVPGR